MKSTDVGKDLRVNQDLLIEKAKMLTESEIEELLEIIEKIKEKRRSRTVGIPSRLN